MTFLRDCVAIDTNVFEHLLNPQENTCGHITVLLTALAKCGSVLIVDEKQEIEKEYNHRLKKLIKAAHNKDQRVGRLLRFWIRAKPKSKTRIAVNYNDALMTGIKRIIPRNSIDRIFVYVALHKDRALISNDHWDIIGEKKNLLRLRKGANSAILTSGEAAACLQKQ